MYERPYPEDFDCCWLASDRVGHLGAFMTAGRGPAPAAVLIESYPLDEIENSILALPKATDIELLVQRHSPANSFVALAERGIFVYYWSDVHRTLRESFDEYELMVRPFRPLTLDQLPDNLLDAARSVRFSKVAFADAWRVNARAHMMCREPHHE